MFIFNFYFFLFLFYFLLLIIIYVYPKLKAPPISRQPNQMKPPDNKQLYNGRSVNSNNSFPGHMNKHDIHYNNTMKGPPQSSMPNGRLLMDKPLQPPPSQNGRNPRLNSNQLPPRLPIDVRTFFSIMRNIFYVKNCYLFI